MKYVTVKTYEELSKMAADIVADVVAAKPDCVIGLATGSSPVGLYNCLAEYCKSGKLDFSKVKSVNLDEYEGLPIDNEQSYRYFMNENLFSKINIDINNTHFPDGCASDLVAEGKKYDELIKSLGGTDVQVLGIGVDGHIGFNEPDDVFTLETHPVVLDESTIEANARFFESIDDVPRHAITMGIGAIMAAKKIVLVANGANKKEIMEKAFFGPIDPKVQASILQVHPDVTVIYSEV